MVLLFWLFSRGLVALIFVLHLEELGGHEFYSVVVNIVLVRPLFGLEVTLDRHASTLGQKVEAIGSLVALPCLDVEDCRYLFLCVTVLLRATDR